jgi:hypothetical protein
MDLTSSSTTSSGSCGPLFNSADFARRSDLEDDFCELAVPGTGADSADIFLSRSPSFINENNMSISGIHSTTNLGFSLPGGSSGSTLDPWGVALPGGSNDSMLDYIPITDFSGLAHLPLNHDYFLANDKQ